MSVAHLLYIQLVEQRADMFVFLVQALILLLGIGQACIDGALAFHEVVRQSLGVPLLQ